MWPKATRPISPSWSVTKLNPHQLIGWHRPIFPQQYVASHRHVGPDKPIDPSLHMWSKATQPQRFKPTHSGGPL